MHLGRVVDCGAAVSRAPFTKAATPRLTPEELRAIDLAAEVLQRVARARGATRCDVEIRIDGRVGFYLVRLNPGQDWRDYIACSARADLLVGGPDPMPSVAVARLAGGGE